MRFDHVLHFFEFFFFNDLKLHFFNILKLILFHQIFFRNTLIDDEQFDYKIDSGIFIIHNKIS